MLLEYIPGLSLNIILKDAGLLTVKDSMFYIGSLIIVLQYLHERDVIYRDLNPDNIIIDQDGFVKLVDFNSAKIIVGKTYTITGTPFYTAPEVIVGKGYGKAADV